MHTPSELGTTGQLLLSEIRNSGAATRLSIQVIEDFKCALGTHVGHRRRRNEDRLILARVSCGFGRYTIAAVCDGVGGSEAGDEAAAVACAAVVDLVVSQATYVEPRELIAVLVRGADEIVRNRLSGSGTTTLSLFLASDRGDFATTNIGDSRIYSWDPNSDLIQLSNDDTLENEFRHLKINNPAFLRDRGLEGSLSQAIGEINRGSDELHIQIGSRQTTPPGGIILASDGIWRSGEEAFSKAAKNSQTPHDAARRALTIASWLGGLDNASIICIADPMTFCEPVGPPMPAKHLEIWTAETKFILIPQTNNYKSQCAPEIEGSGDKPIKRARRKSVKPSKPRKEKADRAQSSRQNELRIEATPDDTAGGKTS